VPRKKIMKYRRDLINNIHDDEWADMMGNRMNDGVEWKAPNAVTAGNRYVNGPWFGWWGVGRAHATSVLKNE